MRLRSSARFWHCFGGSDKHLRVKSSLNLDMVWIETKLNQEPLLVGSFYRPPDAKVAYWDLIDESIRLAMSTPFKVVILGDFNSNFTHGVPRHPQFKRILDLNSLNQVVNEPTRRTEETATLIDVILTSFPATNPFVENHGMLPPIKSDHFCPFIEISFKGPATPVFRRTLYNYAKLDTERFLDKLKNIDWNEIINSETVDMSAESFVATLFDTAKQCMPVKSVIERANDAPWITNEIKNNNYKEKKHSYYC